MQFQFPLILCSLITMFFNVSAHSNSAVEQRTLGKVRYAEQCASCHQLTLRGGAHGSELTGSAFLKKWADKSTLQLLEYNRNNMPPGTSHTLATTDHLAIISHILAVNGTSLDLPLDTKSAFAIGSGETKSVDVKENEALDSWSGADTIDEIAKSRSAFENKQVEDYHPVTTEMLNNPPDGDWLSWRRTLDGHGYSPLKQINTKTIAKLNLSWVIAMRDGSNQVTPLVHDGIMYLTHPGNIVQALDASNGELIWEYAYPFPPEAKTLGGPLKNIAIYGNNLYVSTYDAAVISIDARSGQLIWRTVKADYREGYTHTSGPIMGDGVVLSGINGCERFKKDGCFVTGHDAQTGEELWRTSTIALTGEYGDESWGGIEPDFRAGSDTWVAGSFDPALKLFFIGTAQAKPWVAASRRMTTQNAALYTNSTLAIDPHTGEIKWHYQHVPGETIDMEVGLERVLVDIGRKQVVFTVGKDGILWKLDRTNGKFLAYTETIDQNIFSNIDNETGKVTYRQDISDAGIGDTISACPGIYGGHNWQAMAYSPDTKNLIIPLHQLCADMVGREVEFVEGDGGFGGDSRSYEMPGSKGLLGKLVSIDVRDLKERWSHEQRAMLITGALTTGGGLVFIGDIDRYIKALDIKTGTVVWQKRLGAPLHGYPITYTAGGKQYLAVPTGMGVFRALTAVISPDIYQPANGQALYVFELSD